jgi:hypothetical protein
MLIVLDICLFQIWRMWNEKFDVGRDHYAIIPTDSQSVLNFT